MAKAILVLDKMPENCRECQFEDQDNFRRRNICNATASDRVISDFEDEIDEDERPDCCPLKELPDESEKDQLVTRLIDLMGQLDHVSNKLDELISEI